MAIADIDMLSCGKVALCLGYTLLKFGTVTGQCLFNVPDVTLVPNFGRILVASLSNVNVASCYGAIIGILWIIGCSLQGTVLNMVSSVFDVVNYNSDNVL